MAGFEEILQAVADLSVSENTKRSQAEALVNSLRATQPQDLFRALLHIATSAVTDPSQVQNQVMGAIILKKFYLDKRNEEKNLWQLSTEEFSILKEQIATSIDFSQPMPLLKRKAEIICSCYREMQNYPELISQLVALLQSQQGPEGEIKKVYAMYIFELLAEYHLPQE
jgi:hypothetical protein